MSELWSAKCQSGMRAGAYRAVGDGLWLSIWDAAGITGATMNAHLSGERARGLCAALLAHGYGPPGPSLGRISRHEWLNGPVPHPWPAQPHPWPWNVAHGSHVPVPYHWLGADAETEDR
ncbi:MAG TPA: hypothetical protein VHY82_15950 [Acetobacteraceae bacterium]|jgi:hypothetical protein|nr:hypothetical protein [Acetobacteraceae bacterium]